MKRIFPSKTIGMLMLGLFVALSVIVGAGIQQTVQAQTPASTAPTPTLADILAQRGSEYDANNQDFDIFFNAMKDVNFLSSLEDPIADLTVFAPTDEAFLKLSRFFNYTGNDESAVLGVIQKAFDDSKQAQLDRGEKFPEIYKLRDLLMYHISYRTQDLTYIKSLTRANIVRTLRVGGENDDPGLRASTFSYFNGELIDASPNLIDPKIITELSDIRASNGILHSIDRVLFPFYMIPPLPVAVANPGAPKTIADVLAESGSDFDENYQDFDILNRLLQAAELKEVFADPNANLTLFAPTDEALIKVDEFFRGNAGFYEQEQESLAYQGIINIFQVIDQGQRVQLPGVGGDAVVLLQKVLKYHVSDGIKTAADIQTAKAPITTLLEGATISYENGKLVDQAPNVADPQLQFGKTDIAASNGIIHVIDYALVPQLFPPEPQAN